MKSRKIIVLKRGISIRKEKEGVIEPTEELDICTLIGIINYNSS